MSIRKRPDYISSGADVVKEKQQKHWSNFCLRIRADLLAKIAISIEKRIGMSKNAWILEAVTEKLDKENLL